LVELVQEVLSAAQDPQLENLCFFIGRPWLPGPIFSKLHRNSWIFWYVDFVDHYPTPGFGRRMRKGMTKIHCLVDDCRITEVNHDNIPILTSCPYLSPDLPISLAWIDYDILSPHRYFFNRHMIDKLNTDIIFSHWSSLIIIDHHW
jgi:hypothetical protein